MFQKILVANRGEIAIRAFRAAFELGARTVAVFPFLYRGSDPALEPLGRALSELLVTDLGQVKRLRVLERARVQVLLDEMDLAERGLVDSTTAARSGRSSTGRPRSSRAPPPCRRGRRATTPS